MKTSVALCTYNGEDFIEEQLLSILHQTKTVDEIVICDDGSTDNTIKIIEQFCSQQNNIILFKNVHNLGVCANFEKACYSCCGDIIFLSDQDDIWEPNKVETITNWFYKNKEKSVVFSNANLIDYEGKLASKNKLWDFVGFDLKNQADFNKGYGFEIIGARCRCTGATMALRRDSLFKFSKYCTNKILHDEIISIYAVLNNSLGFINQALTQYRIHPKQQTGVQTTPNTDKYSKYDVNSRCHCYLLLPINEKWKSRIDFFVLRSDFPKKALTHIGKYYKIYKSAGILFWLYDAKKTIMNNLCNSK